MAGKSEEGTRSLRAWTSVGSELPGCLSDLISCIGPGVSDAEIGPALTRRAAAKAQATAIENKGTPCRRLSLFIRPLGSSIPNPASCSALTRIPRIHSPESASIQSAVPILTSERVQGFPCCYGRISPERKAATGIPQNPAHCTPNRLLTCMPSVELPTAERAGQRLSTDTKVSIAGNVTTQTHWLHHIRIFVALVCILYE